MEGSPRPPCPLPPGRTHGRDRHPSRGAGRGPGLATPAVPDAVPDGGRRAETELARGAARGCITWAAGRELRAAGGEAAEPLDPAPGPPPRPLGGQDLLRAPPAP